MQQQFLINGVNLCVVTFSFHQKEKNDESVYETFCIKDPKPIELTFLCCPVRGVTQCYLLLMPDNQLSTTEIMFTIQNNNTSAKPEKFSCITYYCILLSSLLEAMPIVSCLSQ